MSESDLETIRDLIQEDVGHRGLRTDPANNLITACHADFTAACRSLAGAAKPVVGIVTGFLIPHAEPPAGETDGPLGALFLARVLVSQGTKVVLITDAFCYRALEAGLEGCGLIDVVELTALPSVAPGDCSWISPYWRARLNEHGPLTHLIAIERVGPSHTEESVRGQKGATDAEVAQFLQEVPPGDFDRCHTMKGRDITPFMSLAHRLFETGRQICPGLTTIGIGDGGNEIGMGKISWQVIRRNIAGGGLVACRVPTDYLIVCGVSNWGAYGLAAGVCLLRGGRLDKEMFSVDRERELLRVMVERGPLVDGMTGKPAESVDGLSFERYASPLRRLLEIYS
jgi:hypothetical protein